MAKMLDLPEEILLKIFGYLSTSHIINNVGRVCRQWKQLTNDWTLHQYAVIDHTLKLREVLKLLRRNREHVTGIELKCRTDLNRILPVVAACTNLVSLKMISCQGQVRNIRNLNNTVNVRLIWQILYRCRRLRVLEMNETVFRSEIRNFCPANTKLRWLSIRSNNNLHVDESRLEELTNLQVLELQGVKLCNEWVLQRMLLNNETTLTVLKLDTWRPPSVVQKLQSSDDELMHFIGRCTNLTKLSLQNNSTRDLTDVGFAYLARLTRLKSLTIVNAKLVTAHALTRLFNEPHVQHIERLNLGRCAQLNRKTLGRIVDRCPNLRKLTLDQYGVRCHCIDVVDLQRVGTRCAHLDHLELHSMGARIGDSLAAIVQSCPNLRSFKYRVHPLKDYFGEYASVLRSVRLKLPKFRITCTTQNGINGYRK